MKKKAAAIVIILLFMTAGCQAQSPVNLSAKNGAGTIAVNLQEDVSKPAVTAAAPDETEAPPWEEPNVQEQQPESRERPINPNDSVIEIKEKMFLTQINEIYYNSEDYLGKTIRYQGIFQIYPAEGTGITYYSVIRYGPGCCGSDGNAGFEVIWDKGYPNDNDWVEVSGVLETYEEDGYSYLRIALDSLTVLDERGEEFMTQ